MNDHNITIYSTPTCPYCDAAKDYFDENDISYTDYDVSENREKAKEMIEKSGQRGTPVIDIDGNVVVGFNKEKIESFVD
ncbi:glutaredoxin family protein [Candidatus Bipolaricaulota bacterium]|nr:glutaredoxin family protein [Candidatus Bipolaricaulota bacterium]MBS3825577.1 glutaredoxin family protein [Candidatus Bipolaricaulota bacterium]